MKNIEKFLINELGVDVLKYRGFIYIKDILEKNDSVVTELGKTYEYLGNKYNSTWSHIERNIRTLKERRGFNGTNKAFVNYLILKYKGVL